MIRFARPILLAMALALITGMANAQSNNDGQARGLPDPRAWPPSTIFSYLWDRNFRISATFPQTSQRGAVLMTRGIGVPPYWCELGSYRRDDQSLPYNVCVRL